MSARSEVEGLRVGRWGSGPLTSSITFRFGRTLIDTGPANCWNSVRTWARERSIDRILLTHHHEDHSGNAARLHRLAEAPVLAPDGARGRLRNGFPIPWYRQLVWGKPLPVVTRPLPEAFQIEGGTLVRAIPAPGHSDDLHVLLLPERGWLFSGDLYLTHQPTFAHEEENVSRLISSLRLVLQYDFDTLFCAHRGRVSGGDRLLKMKLDHLLDLRERAREEIRKGRTIRAATYQLLGFEPPLAYLSGFAFSKRRLVEGLLSGAGDA